MWYPRPLEPQTSGHENLLRPWQVNEWGENLDELQETYTKRVGLKRAASLNLDMIENPTDSRRRQNSGKCSSLPSTRQTQTHKMQTQTLT